MIKYQSRKLWLVLFVFISTMALLVAGKIDGSMYVTVTIGIVGAYIAGNIMDYKVNQGRDKEGG
jgi:uncharacterized membrane protein YeaQ/YmgE (transglycosylase-associated protein family)